MRFDADAPICRGPNAGTLRGCHLAPSGHWETDLNFRKIAALAMLALTAGSIVACSEKENAFAAARRNDQEATAAALRPTVAPVSPATPAPGQPAAQPTVAPAVTGNAARGQTLFASLGCAACHSTGSNTVVGPGLQGISTRATVRVPGLTAGAYVKQSVREPGAFVVPTFNNLMPLIYATMPDADLNDIVAYLLSLK